MKIFIIFSVISIAFIFIGNKLIYSAKRNLFKDQAAWSGKDIKIKYLNSAEVSDLGRNDNLLKKIADESAIFLENESKKENDEIY